MPRCTELTRGLDATCNSHLWCTQVFLSSIDHTLTHIFHSRYLHFENERLSVLDFVLDTFLSEKLSSKLNMTSILLTLLSLCIDTYPSADNTTENAPNTLNEDSWCLVIGYLTFKEMAYVRRMNSDLKRLVDAKRLSIVHEAATNILPSHERREMFHSGFRSLSDYWHYLMNLTWSSPNLYDYIELELMFLDIGDNIMHEAGWITEFYCKMLNAPHRFNLSLFDVDVDDKFKIFCLHIQDLVYSAVKLHYQEGVRRIVQGLVDNDGLHILTYFEFFPMLKDRFSRGDSDEQNRFSMFCETVIYVGIESDA